MNLEAEKLVRIFFIEMMGVPGSTLLASSSKLPIAALDFGNHCYTTQFHSEATEETLGTIWQHKAPELMLNYHTRNNGDQLVGNFLGLVKDLSS